MSTLELRKWSDQLTPVGTSHPGVRVKRPNVYRDRDQRRPYAGWDPIAAVVRIDKPTPAEVCRALVKLARRLAIDAPPGPRRLGQDRAA
jgi:hypothetical protein